MSQSLQAQVEVGGLSIASLASFKAILAAVSADNVDALAVVQLRELGTYFHASGKYLDQLPDLMRRCNSTRLERIGLAIGWNKGDVSSAMAESAGGQSIALLCFCLHNLYPGQAGFILSKLGQKVLPPGSPLASRAQLQACAELFASKLGSLGFGNIWAEHISRLGSVYKSLGKVKPREFFDKLSPESMADVLHALSKAFTEEYCIVRISGDRCIAGILAVVAISFPDDLLVQVDGYIVQKGPRQLIILNISDQESPVPLVRTESSISRERGFGISFTIDRTVKDVRWDVCNYAWRGHLADALSNEFEQDGIQVSSPLLRAIGDFAACAIYATGDISPLSRKPAAGRPKSSTGEDPKRSLLDLLGLYPKTRISKTVSEILRVQLLDICSDSFSLKFCTLRDAFCECLRNTRNPCWSKIRGFNTLCPGVCEVHSFGVLRGCRVCRLWQHVSNAVMHTMRCSLISAAPRATIYYHGDIYLSLYYNQPFLDSLLWQEFSALHTLSMTARLSDVQCHSLARSDGSSSIFPTILSTLALDLDRGYEYTLLDGQLMLDGHKIFDLRSARARSERWRPTVSTAKDAGQYIEITPSLIREFSSITLSVSDQPEHVELLTCVNLTGRSLYVDLFDTIRASMAAVKDRPCEHDLDNPLVVKPDDFVKEKTMAYPAPEEGYVGIVQTKNDPEAQLLACIWGIKAVVKRDSCLSCAVKYARSLDYNTVIVAT